MSLDLIASLLQGLMLIFFAPLIPGIVEYIRIRMSPPKHPPRLGQYYLEISKAFGKEPTVPPEVTPLFRYAPLVVFACYGLMGFLMPVFLNRGLQIADFMTLALILGLGKFALVLAGMDAETPTGGLGGSREIFFHMIIEPLFFVMLAAIAIQWQTTGVFEVVKRIQQAEPQAAPVIILTWLAFLFILIGENGRMPVDNLYSHLELTMIQKALGLEYAGWRLALIYWADAIRLTFFLTMSLNLLWHPSLKMKVAVASTIWTVPVVFVTAGVVYLLLKIPRIISAAIDRKSKIRQIALWHIVAAFSIVLLSCLSWFWKFGLLPNIIGPLVPGLAWMCVLPLTAVALGLWESSQVRLRLRRVANTLFIGTGLSILAAILAIILGV